MNQIGIEIIAVSEDQISVSIDYDTGLSPLVKRWHAARPVVDGIYDDVLATFEEALAEPLSDTEAKETREATENRLRSLGLALFQEIFKDECDHMRELIAGGPAACMVFKLDKSLAYLPLEIMHDGKAFVSHRLAQGRVIYAQEVKGVSGAPRTAPYAVVLVGDPSEDARIAQDVEEEIDAVRDIFAKRREFSLRVFVGGEVDQKLMLANLPGSTVFHFTGHGVLSEKEHETGIKLRDGGVLSGYALAGLYDPPLFAFLNVCTAASRGAWKGSLGLIETLLRRGTRACVASLWDLRSKSAAFMASEFYTELLKGQPAGEALRKARIATARQFGLNDPTWAAHTLYGDPQLRLVAAPVPRAQSAGTRASKRASMIAVLAAVLIVCALIFFPRTAGKDKITPQEKAQEQVQHKVTLGNVLIESAPPGARILMDGKEAGVTPDAFEVPVGTHLVVLEKEGYKRWEASVEVKIQPRADVRAFLIELK